MIFGPNLCHTGVIDRYSRCLCWVRALECHHWRLRWVAMAICSVVLEARVHTAIITASFPPPTICDIPIKQKSTKLKLKLSNQENGGKDAANIQLAEH